MAVFFVCLFFNQKTAYEMRISDWSSDVCSSDLGAVAIGRGDDEVLPADCLVPCFIRTENATELSLAEKDRKSVVSGKSVSVRVDLGGRRIINNNVKMKTMN